MTIGGRQLDPRSVTEGFDARAPIPHAPSLAAFAEAVVARDWTRAASLRHDLREALGDAGLVDAAAIVAAFHGFVRVADAIGIPYTTAAMGQDAPDLRAEAGINDFYRVRAGGT
jgi:hypothetical protein